VEAAQQAGYPYNADYNGDHQLGVGYMQLSQRRGWRASTARAYLAPARRRPNLRLEKEAVVTRVLIEKDRAVGVEYRQGGALHTVRARREVLLSAGALASPKLLMLSVSHPKQRGMVGLRSADPADGPHIVHQLLGNPGDLKTLIAASRRARDIAATDAMRPYVTGELMPGPQVQTDEEWIDYFRTYAYRGEHPAGTCRMGTDKLAVVDPQLKVHGVDGLRVVDTSVMPTLTSGHTNAPTIMIAERASDFIRAEANAR
jgi:choline dehydrogenase-like flavoprotein